MRMCAWLLCLCALSCAGREISVQVLGVPPECSQLRVQVRTDDAPRDNGAQEYGADISRFRVGWQPGEERLLQISISALYPDGTLAALGYAEVDAHGDQQSIDVPLRPLRFEQQSITPMGRLQNVWADEGGQLWLAGEQGLWTGPWKQLRQVVSGESLYGLHGSGGVVYAAGLKGVLFRGQNGAAVPDRTLMGLSDDTNLTGVWAAGNGDLWVAGNRKGDSGVVLRRSGNQWRDLTTQLPPQQQDSPPIYGMWASSLNDAWFIADGTVRGTGLGVIHWDGVGFQGVPIAGPMSRGFGVVKQTGAVDLWVSGDQGLLLNWNQQQVRVTDLAGCLVGHEMRGLFGSHRMDVWAVGFGGTIVHYDGARWTCLRPPTLANLRGVFGRGVVGQGGDLWIVGDGGVVLRMQ